MGQHGLRDMACNLASINWAKAAEYAKQIDDPWYACQAFAWCGKFAPSPDSERLIDKALQWAASGKDVYQQVAATAWPLRALIEIAREDRAEEVFTRIAGFAHQIELNSSRGEACLLVFEAVVTARKEFVLKALRWLLSECQPVEHWRQKRAICHGVIQTVSIHWVNPVDLLPMVQDERLRNNISMRINNGEKSSPRPFIWQLK